MKNKIIAILEELIVFCESVDRTSMRNVYQSIKDDLLNGVPIDKKWARTYFSGYLLKADPPEYEYIRVEKYLISIYQIKVNAAYKAVKQKKFILISSIFVVKNNFLQETVLNSYFERTCIKSSCFLCK